MKQHWTQFSVVLLEKLSLPNEANGNDYPFLSYQTLSLYYLRLTTEKPHYIYTYINTKPYQ